DFGQELLALTDLTDFTGQVVDRDFHPREPPFEQLQRLRLGAGAFLVADPFRAQDAHRNAGADRNGDGDFRSDIHHRVSNVIANRPVSTGLLGLGSTVRSQRPVCDASTAATSSGRPMATTRPPCIPASGPRSITQSASLITSRLCSISTSVCPASTSRSKTWASLRMSSRCS